MIVIKEQLAEAYILHLGYMGNVVKNQISKVNQSSYDEEQVSEAIDAIKGDILKYNNLKIGDDVDIVFEGVQCQKSVNGELVGLEMFYYDGKLECIPKIVSFGAAKYRNYLRPHIIKKSLPTA